MHIVKKMVLWYDYCVWKVMHMKRWNDLFQQEIQKPYYQELMAFLDEEYKTKAIFPPREDLFTCFDVCPYEKVKVVILGGRILIISQIRHMVCVFPCAAKAATKSA